LRAAVNDPEYEDLYVDDDKAWQVKDIISSRDYWLYLRASIAVLQPIRDVIYTVEADRPLLSSLIPIWTGLRSKLSAALENPANATLLGGKSPGAILGVFDKRYEKNYQPAFAAAYHVDPLHLEDNGRGQFLPTADGHKGFKLSDAVDALKGIVPEEDHAQLEQDLVTWRYHGVPAATARALQARVFDPETGKSVVTPVVTRKRLWEVDFSSKLPALAKAASHLLSLHATSCGPERNWSEWRAVYRPNRLVYT
jgi:hypothetical protein